jgi:DNA-binding response OmpR family regulator
MTTAGIENETRALIIDDEIDICFLLKGILKHKNIEAKYVTSLTEAQNVIQEFEPPVIFLDNHLKDGFGLNYVRKIKTKLPRAKVVMITAHDSSSDREKAYEEGVDFFIGKPFTSEMILNAIEKINTA